MDRKGAVRCVERSETREEEGEVFRFVEGYFCEVGEELEREGYCG